jgi:tRNA A-37 threonylcarbamoyl transferase component Bud32
MKLIASGAQADVYFDGGKAIKLFKYPLSQEEIAYEVNLHRMAFEYGLPVPEIYDIVKADGKRGIVMEYLEGESLGEKMARDSENIAKYIIESVEIQMKINSIVTDTFPSMKNKLEWQIARAKYIAPDQKYRINKIFSEKIFRNNLCHGDLHVMNLMSTKTGVKIIDWVDASSGSVAADVCRTYVLYKTHKPEIAEIYLEVYCEKSKITRAEILSWTPVIAGARLSEEGINENGIKRLLEIIEESTNYTNSATHKLCL